MKNENEQKSLKQSHLFYTSLFQPQNFPQIYLPYKNKLLSQQPINYLTATKDITDIEPYKQGFLVKRDNNNHLVPLQNSLIIGTLNNSSKNTTYTNFAKKYLPYTAIFPFVFKYVNDYNQNMQDQKSKNATISEFLHSPQSHLAIMNPTEDERKVIEDLFKQKDKEVIESVYKHNTQLAEAIDTKLSQKNPKSLINTFFKLPFIEQGNQQNEILDKDQFEVIQDEAQEIANQEIVKNAQSIYGNKVSHQPSYMIDLIKNNVMYAHYNKYAHKNEKEEIIEENEQPSNKIAQTPIEIQDSTPKQEIPEYENPHNILSIQKRYFQKQFEQVYKKNEEDFQNIVKELEERDRIYFTLMYLPYRNLLLNIEGVCFDKQFTFCSEVSNLLESLYINFKMNFQRDFEVIKEIIIESLQKYEPLLKSLNEVLSDFVSLSEKQHSRLQYLLHDYKFNSQII